MTAYRKRKCGISPLGEGMGTEIPHKGHISSETEAGPLKAINQQSTKESWVPARPWPSCPGIRLPLRSSRKIGGFGVKIKVKIKTPF